MSVLRAVTQVRKRQRPARQGRRGAAPRRGPRGVRVTNLSRRGIGPGSGCSRWWKRGSTMVLLGLLLILACAALAVDAVMQNGGAVHATVFGHGVSGLSVGTLFVAGAVTGLVFALG